MQITKIIPDIILTYTSTGDEYFDIALDFCKQWAAGQQNFIRHTSGSTGQPKPIALTRNQIEASILATQKALALRAGQVSLVCLNVGFIAGTMMLARAMYIGQTLVIVQPESNPLLQIPKNEQIDFAAFVPLQLQAIIEANMADRLNAMQCIIVGGAAVGQKLKKQIETLTVPVYATYGMTETVSHIALQRLNGAEKSDFFTFLEGIETAINDQNCLKIKGLVTKNEWIQTNDIVEWVGERSFKIVGRADNVINSGGIKISLEKVERAIENTHILTQRFYCWHKPDARLGQKLILVVEGQSNDDLLTQIKPILEQSLSHYEIPKEVVFLDKFVETATGKIKRH